MSSRPHRPLLFGVCRGAELKSPITPHGSQGDQGQLSVRPGIRYYRRYSNAAVLRLNVRTYIVPQEVSFRFGRVHRICCSYKILNSEQTDVIFNGRSSVIAILFAVGAQII
jgi:hypothetical protein